MITRIRIAVFKLLDASYFLKFLLRLFAFYLLFRSINWLCVALITPEGYYSSFIDHYLDYVTALKLSILHTASFFAQLFNVPSHLVTESLIETKNGGQLYMEWACCGLEIMSFWAAFALADTTPLSTKFKWCIGGLLSIWMINCIRVMFLLLATENHWQTFLHLDHHQLFNIVGYSFVFLLMLIYYRNNKSHLGING